MEDNRYANFNHWETTKFILFNQVDKLDASHVY